ncbi:MAG: putative multi-sensor signal transduction histidine kinase [Gammaproteobacteria bacterium]|nr:putative multi-sensor signal transduction histidine kinase [Gammaproteobacteria bacterium]
MKPGVLIVDDSLTVRMALDEAFTAAGILTTLCSTMAEARSAIVTGSFALIVLDVLMPDGDGIDLLREIRNAPATSRTIVMLLSTETEVQDRTRGLETGADEYIGKPYDESYVVARALELLRNKEPGRGDEGLTTVLIIDDSPTFREELRSVLESSGYTVVTAATGEDGLRGAVAARPAAIVVDGVLPGIDGATVIRRIRADAALRGTPCILLTGSEDRSGELDALDAGADAYVRKEDNTQMILARVTAILRSTRSRYPVGSTASLLGPKRILAVDDSLTYLHDVAENLRKEGYDVIPARSGEEALELLLVQPVDCILLDLMMPGLSGQDTCRRIKASAAWRDIPLIMHTALEEQAAMIAGINAGADDYIAKSSDLEVLFARVRAQLRRKQFEDENRNIREQLLQKEREVVVAHSARELAETRAVFVEQLERKNSELEAFSYSVSHDLRAPLRSIDGFSKLLLDDHAGELNAKGQDYLHFVRAAAQRMGELIDDLLLLSRVGRADLRRDRVDLSSVARVAAERLKREDPGRQVTICIEDQLVVVADDGLMRVLLENLLGNAWKFTTKTLEARIEVGAEQHDDGTVFFVRDNGAGFDMSHAKKLFNPFQRLHTESEFPGTGIGLATVHRIIDRHGGRISADSVVDQGATFYFTIPTVRPGARR